MRGNTLRMAALAAAISALLGCAPDERQVTQGVMPLAINYYVLTQEAVRLRAEVKAAQPQKLAVLLPKYGEIVTRGQQMLAENTALTGLGKNQDFVACLDSSLQTQVGFLATESQAVRALSDNAVARDGLERIENQNRGNSLATARNQPELERLSALAQSSAVTLESLLPKLQSLSRLNLTQMKRYNQMVLERKILTYTATDSVLALLDWEQMRGPAKPAARKKAASKKTGSARRR